MNIPINKDLEEEYKNEIVKGFTLREAGYIALSAAIIAGVTFFMWKNLGLSPDTCIYMGLPFGIPTLFLGFRKFQGLSAAAYLKEILYERRTKILIYDADEILKENHVFTMQREEGHERWKK